MVTNYSNQVNMCGMDEVVNNERTRALAIQGPNAQGVLWMAGTGVVTSLNPGATQTLTAAQLGGGIVVINPSTTNTTTLDTATNIVNYMNANSSGIQAGDILQCLVINGQGTNTLTLAAGSGGAFDTNQLAAAQIIPANSTKNVTIRITNVTTPAYVMYC